MNYISNTDIDEHDMLHRIGVDSFEELLTEIPRSIRLKKDLDLPDPLSEMELTKVMKSIASKNRSPTDYVSFLGAGSYDHYIPSIISHLTSRSEFYTAYTPYQAEVSQGTLQAIYEYQSLICRLTGMEISNASLYDCGSAVAEAALMAVSSNKKKKVVLSGAIHPYYRQVVDTYLQGSPFESVVCPAENGKTDFQQLNGLCDEDTSCVIIQYPNFFGIVENPASIRNTLASCPHIAFIMVTNPVSLGILASPADWGADIVVGEGQSLGNPQNFGGPSFGFLACREEYKRYMPGRLVGATQDTNGRKGFVLTLQTREQHIRREKSTSNICTNQALNALAASIYMITMGRSGFREVADHCFQKAHYMAEKCLTVPGVNLEFDGPFFNEFVLHLPVPPEGVRDRFLDEKLFYGVPLEGFYPELKNCLLVAVTEKRTRAQIDRYVRILRESTAGQESTKT
jgi:glycine dehydrogenase subunit 1